MKARLFITFMLPLCLFAEEQIYKYRPLIEDNCLFLHEEFLYWKTVENNTDFAAYTLPASSTNLGSGVNGTIEGVHFIPKFGIRLGVGYRFKPAFWELELQYTYFHPHGTNRLNPRTGYTLVSTNSLVSTTPLTHAYGHISLEENIAELTLARRFLVNNNIICKLDITGSGAWFHQNLTNEYFSTNNLSVATLHQEWKFHGGGINLGLDVDWYIGKGFSLVGKAAFGMLFGHYNNNFYQQETVNTTTAVIGDTHFQDHRIVPRFQIFLGPSYGRMLGHFGFNLYAAWELNNYWNLHEMHLTDLTSSYSNTRASRYVSGVIGTQGLTTGISLFF